MAKFTLIPFKKSNNHFEIDAQANVSDNHLFISFNLAGNLTPINFGDYQTNHQRKMQLWENTCFEFFIKNKQDHYIEFNFSPRFEWNAFYFEKIRGPLTEMDLISPPTLDILNSSSRFYLIAKIDLNNFPNSFKDSFLEQKFSFNTVIKLKSDDYEYWALKHCDSKPNFHLFDSFIGKF